jgi:hypothetical protein
LRCDEDETESERRAELHRGADFRAAAMIRREGTSSRQIQGIALRASATVTMRIWL